MVLSFGRGWLRLSLDARIGSAQSLTLSKSHTLSHSHSRTQRLLPIDPTHVHIVLLASLFTHVQPKAAFFHGYS